MNKILIFTLLALASGSCKKKPYPTTSEEESPIYTVTGSLNGSEFNISDGVGDVKQSVSTKLNNVTGVYEYKSSFISNSANNPFELNFTVNGAKSPTSASEDIATALTIGQYNFEGLTEVNSNPTTFKVLAECSDTNADIVWNIKSQEFHFLGSIEETNPINTVEMDETELINEIHFGNSTIIQESIIYFDTLLQPVIEKPTIYFSFFSQGSGIFSVLPVVLNKQNYEILKIELDGQYVNQSEPIELDLNSGYSYLIAVSIKSKISNEKMDGYFTFNNVFYPPHPTSFTMGKFDYANKSKAPINTSNSIEINYVKDGKTYTSVRDFSQPPLEPYPNSIPTLFDVKSIADGELTMEGKKTKLVKANFSGTLINVSNPTDVVNFENLGLKMAFEY